MPRIYWYRIDKSNGDLWATDEAKVLAAARAHYADPAAVMMSGRFSTPFAIYSTGAKLTPQDERGALPPPQCGL